MQAAMRKGTWALLAAVLLLAGVARSGEDPLAAAVQPYVERKVLAGAVAAVATKDGLKHLATVGYADIAAQKAMPPDALFWIASMTKPITGTALMILVDEGKVQLDDPVEKYLPEFKGLQYIAEKGEAQTVLKKPAQPITIRQIMCHTSGLAFKSAVEAPTLDNLPLYQAVLSYTAAPLVYEPGTKYLYSNEGINTGGRIIEVVSKMPYEEFLQKRLFEPLGMTDTTFWPTDDQNKRIAQAYKPNAAKDGLEPTGIWALRTPYTDRTRRFPMPGGGLFSTAQDLAKFSQMLLNGGTFNGTKILSPEAIREMWKRSTPEALKESYGIGWTVAPDAFGHGGAYATNLTIDTKRGIATIWLVQHNGFPGDGGKAQGAFKKAADEAFGK